MPQVKVPGNVWDDVGFLDRCEKRRQRHKKRIGRLTYDCEYAHIFDMRVRCMKNKTLDKLSTDGSMYLLAVLRGRTSFACRSCKYYSEG